MATQNSVDTEEAERAKRESFLKAKAVYGPELYEVAKVEQYDWYVGMLGRNDVEPYLKKQGEYAIRAHDHRTFSELVLSVRSVTMVNHITLVCDKVTRGWALTTTRGPDTKFFATIPELIEHYRKDFLPIAPPNDRVILTQACKRPKWILKRQNVEPDNNSLLGSGNFCTFTKENSISDELLPLKFVTFRLWTTRRQKSKLTVNFWHVKLWFVKGKSCSQFVIGTS